MKIIFAVFLLAIFSLAGSAQDKAIEKDFSRNVRKYKVEKYSMGEDATSGYDYVIYKSGKQIVKIRTVWSSSANPKWTVEDAYYKTGVPVLLVKMSLKKAQFKPVIQGSLITLPQTEKFYFKDSRMVRWIENGKMVPTTDKRWAEAGEDAIASAKDALEFYPTLKDLK